MFPAQFPDWRHIGWHIGKKLKDIISPEDPGPSKEERLAQRLRDALKGFTYFDDFEQVEKWQSHDVIDYQRANTPLLRRSEPGYTDSKLSQTSKLILCHDYKGGYHDYEGVRPLPITSAVYSCDYLQYVDTFIYFSHKLVCIPPPTWTNTLHRNGVKVLGTFILEPQTTDANNLWSKLDGKYHIAKQLAAMALHYGFDGWLLNVEKEFTTNMTTEMLNFITELKEGLGTGYQVIWYDALTVENELKYQNGLTSKNLKFTRAANALFTNYKWTESNLHMSKDVALQSGVDPTHVFFGIDTWAQNTNVLGSRRVTFPSEGGGGTNTGLAASVLCQHNLSTAIFAPAWPYEHFPTVMSQGMERTIAKAVDRSMWEGVILPEELGCDCRKGRPHHTLFYRSNPIIGQFNELPSGSNQFFETHFNREINDISTSRDETKLLPTIGWQDPKPTLDRALVAERESGKRDTDNEVLYCELGAFERMPQGFHGISCLKIYGKLVRASAGASAGASAENPVGVLDSSMESSRKNQPLYRLPLYALSMISTNLWAVKAACWRARAGRSMEMGIYVAYRVSTNKEKIEYEYHMIEYNPQANVPFSTSAFLSGNNGGQLSELGVYCIGVFEPTEPLLLMELKWLSVMPESAKPITSEFAVRDLKIGKRGKGPYLQKYLVWAWHGSRVGWPDILPWSDTTGPFSYFEISINGRWLGRSYSVEFPLADDDTAESGRDSEGRLMYVVKGTFFGSFPSSQDHIASFEL